MCEESSRVFPEPECSTRERASQPRNRLRRVQSPPPPPPKHPHPKATPKFPTRTHRRLARVAVHALAHDEVRLLVLDHLQPAAEGAHLALDRRHLLVVVDVHHAVDVEAGVSGVYKPGVGSKPESWEDWAPSTALQTVPRSAGWTYDSVFRPDPRSLLKQ